MGGDARGDIRKMATDTRKRERKEQGTLKVENKRRLRDAKGGEDTVKHSCEKEKEMRCRRPRMGRRRSSDA